ncbi:MAG: DUF5677 domain-containing protein [Roseiarcus sp.]
MADDDEIKSSIRDAGFLSPGIADLVPMYRRQSPAWFDLIEGLNTLGQRQMHRGIEKAAKLSSLDPINIATRLFMRTMSNFQGSVLLAERGMVVEAQTLTRNCYENSFWIGAFLSSPTEALEAFQLDETKSQDSRADAFLRIVDEHGDEAAQKETREQFASRREKSKKAALGLEKLAKLAGLHPSFAFYKEASASSAHPSLYSIDRYFDKVPSGWQGFVGGPDTPENVTLALSLTCHALIGALAAFGQLIGQSDDDQKLFDLNTNYKVLAGVAE